MNENIHILTGPVGTGKTTRLIDWAMKREDVRGIATPVIRNKRIFFDLSTHEVFSMEAMKEDSRTLHVGKYIFNQASFTRAEKIIREGMDKGPGYLVIDEIGPLELNGKGFSSILKKILSIDERNYNLVLVIRDSILENALAYFSIIKFQALNLD